MSAIVRGYRSDDLEACRHLWVELTQRHRDMYSAPEIGGAEPGRKFDAHLAEVGEERLWVAEDDGAVVGLVGLMFGDEGHIEIEPVVVTQSRRGEGIGRVLVDHVLEVARAEGHRSLSVRVAARNRAAIEFYHAQGFQILGLLELMTDFRTEERRWQPGERVADRDFLV